MVSVHLANSVVTAAIIYDMRTFSTFSKNVDESNLHFYIIHVSIKREDSLRTYINYDQFDKIKYLLVLFHMITICLNYYIWNFPIRKGKCGVIRNPLLQTLDIYVRTRKKHSQIYKRRRIQTETKIYQELNFDLIIVSINRNTNFHFQWVLF